MICYLMHLHNGVRIKYQNSCKKNKSFLFFLRGHYSIRKEICQLVILDEKKAVPWDEKTDKKTDIKGRLYFRYGRF